MKTFENYFFLKIKFKGKGFKIKFNKKLKLIKFYFGRSHITFFKLKKIKLKKITKYKFLLKNLNFNKLKKKASEITYIKPVNVYTLRGIRLSRQHISKRKGKKSSYI
jgi:ribosomal protein L6P/L9E